MGYALVVYCSGLFDRERGEGMSSFARKLRRIKQRKNAVAESKLWTSDDWAYFRGERFKLMKDGAPREAASRRAFHATSRHVVDSLDTASVDSLDTASAEPAIPLGGD